ncbi:MAG: hypothetical protein Ct9H300mP11_08320 [Chloroflexota bacterium]|nr:MAG: hypothetical protein Ct9H300mP11_08320 [Chloroflexota bacterium]
MLTWNSQIHQSVRIIHRYMDALSPAAEIMIAMNTELVNDAPELISFFQNWDWSAGNH